MFSLSLRLPVFRGEYEPGGEYQHSRSMGAAREDTQAENGRHAQRR